VRFEVEIESLGPALGFDVPFDPNVEFGKVRAPVRVTINGYEFATTIGAMSGRYLVGLNKEVRALTRVEAGDRVDVELVLDEEPRTVEVPADLAAALDPDSRAFLDSLSHTDRKEYVRWVEQAKREEPRRARIEQAAARLAEQVRHP